MPPTAADWSDSRKRSRFTNGGAAVTAIPILEIRRLLAELQASAASQLSTAYETDGRDESTGDDPAREATRLRARQELNEIEAAQQRMADGNYGTCFRCGRPIPVSRLRALPYTRYCITCDRHRAGRDTSEASKPRSKFPRGR